MRVLIISAAILASALAAPSGFLVPAAQVFAIPAATPTIPPGDIQAAVINAKVRAEDEARFLADQSILLADQAKEQAELNLEFHKDKQTEVRDELNLRSDLTFWQAEDNKWQAYDAVNSAHAKLDGSVANNADGIAKFAVKSAAFIPPAPVLAPSVPSIVYASPGIVAPDIKAYSAQQSEKQPSNDEKQESAAAPAPESVEPLKSSLPESPTKTAEDFKKAVLEMYKIAEQNNNKAAQEALKMVDVNFKQYTEGFKDLDIKQLENWPQIALKIAAAEKETSKNLVAAQILTSSPYAFAPTFAYNPYYASLAYFKPTTYSASYSHIPPTFYKTIW